jgi:hypothetical protein
MSRSWSTCEALTFGRVPEKDYRALEESFVIVLAASHDMQVKAYVKGKRVYLEFKQPGDALELLWQEVRIHNQLVSKYSFPYIALRCYCVAFLLRVLVQRVFVLPVQDCACDPRFLHAEGV